MCVLVLFSLLAMAISFCSAQVMDPCASMLCPSGEMCVAVVCDIAPCPEANCVSDTRCPSCSVGSSCRIVAGNYVCEQINVPCCQAVAVCPTGYSETTTCTSSEISSGTCISRRECCTSIMCRLNENCSTGDCCSTDSDVSIAQKIKKCKCQTESVCAQVKCASAVDCAGVSICDSQPCNPSANCVPSTATPLSDFNCNADPCATGPCLDGQLCESKDGQVVCREINSLPCCEAYATCMTYESASQVPCKSGEPSCRRETICCSEVFCRGGAPTVRTCANGPCGSDELCFDDRKVCVTAPCEQFRCEAMPSACCEAAAACTEGQHSSSVPCDISEGGSCTRSAICCNEVFCRASPPASHGVDPCVYRPCAPSTYCNNLETGFQCVASSIQCRDIACAAIAFQCPSGYSPVQNCVSDGTAKCIRLTRPQCCDDQICMSDSHSSSNIPNWVWIVVGVSSVVLIAIIGIRVYMFYNDSNEDSQSDSDSSKRVPTPIHIKQAPETAYPYPEDSVPTHPVESEWNHSKSGGDGQI